jgi:hypothetical protein
MIHYLEKNAKQIADISMTIIKAFCTDFDIIVQIKSVAFK